MECPEEGGGAQRTQYDEVCVAQSHHRQGLECRHVVGAAMECGHVVGVALAINLHLE